MAAEINTIIEAAEDQGWKVEARKGGHIKFTSPDGQPVFVASTPSDHRSLKNIVRDLRRHGFRYDQQGGKRLSVVGADARRAKRRRRKF